MPGEKYTRCPGCSTVFRVMPEQLALRAGQVRCGQCKTVFNGIEQQVSLAAPNPPEEPLSEPPQPLNKPTNPTARAAARRLKVNMVEP